MNRKTLGRLAILGIVAALVAAFFLFDLGQYFTLNFLRAQHQDFVAFYENNTALTIAIYFVIYVVVTGLSLPGAAIMTLAGGAVFGLVVGTVVVSFASTIGATLAFLVSRFIARDYVQTKFADKLAKIKRGVEEERTFYLFTLRLIPIFPFFVINLVMGLTPIRTLPYFVVSQLGMLPGTIVYVNAGSQLADIDSLSGILSPSLLLSFALLGLFPLIAKKVVAFIKARRLHNANSP
jgi:uncharacterized membrane protein YdjX (TVP38/TMEM64 family)